MKKQAILASFLFLSASLLADMEVERGYGNFELATHFQSIQEKGKKEANPFKEIHDFVHLQNEFVWEQGNTISWDKEVIYRPYIIGSTGNKYNSIGGGILLYRAIEDGKYMGIQLEGRNISFKTDEKKEKTTRGTLRFLWDYQQEIGNRLLISPYFSFDNLKEIRNRTIGIYAKEEIPLSLAKYGLPEEGMKLYVDVDAHRNSIKKQPGEKKGMNKNDSIKAGIGVSYSQAIEVGNSTIVTPKIEVGYEREFMEKKKYKSMEGKEKNVDLAKVSVGIQATISNVEVNVQNTFYKSVNTDYYGNRVSAGFVYKF